MTSVVVAFVDDYLDTYTNKYRDQVLIMLQSKTYFLTEFIDKIVELIGKMSSGSSKYGQALGYAKLDTTASSKQVASFADFQQLWNKKQGVLNNMYDNYSPDRKVPSFYNKILIRRESKWHA